MISDNGTRQRPGIPTAIIAFFIALAGIYIAAVAMLLVGGGLGSTAIGINVIAQVVFFGLPVLYIYNRHAVWQPSARLRRLDPLAAVVIVFAAVVGMMALNIVTVYWMDFLQRLGLTTRTGNEMTPTTPSALAWMLIAAAMVPALLEEALFRGLVLPSLEGGGTIRAALISGTLFALMHARLEALPAHLILGFALGLLALRTGSLFAPMLFHGVYNAVILILSYMAYDPAAPEAPRALMTQAEMVENLPMALALLAVWALLMHTAIARAQKRDKNPLPPVARERLQGKDWLALGLAFAAALALLAVAVYGMLPGRGA